MTLTIEIMQKMWPHGDQHVRGLVEGIAKASVVMLDSLSPLVVAHMMAQFSHECGAGLEMIENLNYSAAGLMRTWPSRFNAARANAYAHNPQMIADACYGGRMGNDPPPSNDGWLYRGRGLSQTTGRDAYEKLGDKLDLDLASDPDLLNDPDYALDAGVTDFRLCGCMEPAEKDDVVGVTRALNGGLIGLAERRDWLRRWKLALDAEKSTTVAAETHEQPAA